MRILKNDEHAEVIFVIGFRIKSSLTLYQQVFFGGEQTVTYEDISELPKGDDNKRYSAIVTGCESWTIYKYEVF